MAHAGRCSVSREVVQEPLRDQCRGVSGLVIMSRMRWACRFPGLDQCGRRSSPRKVIRPRFAGAGVGAE
jgi:hypothetical protein